MLKIASVDTSNFCVCTCIYVGSSSITYIVVLANIIFNTCMSYSMFVLS